MVTFIITLVVTALISVIITSMYYKYRHELKQDKTELVDVKKIKTEQQKDQRHNPNYEDIILKKSDPDYALSTSTIKMDINPAYGEPSTIKMDANPAYASTNI